MRTVVHAFLAICLALGVAVGCGGGEGAGPGPGVAPADLAGTWRADGVTFTSRQDSSQSVDLVALGGRFTLTISTDSTYWAVTALPAQIPDIDTGHWVLAAGFLLVTDDSVPGKTSTFQVTLSGSDLTLATDEEEFDFDGDGNPDPATLTLALTRVTGPTVSDLEGSWAASVFRFVSAPVARDTIDFIAMGGGLTVDIGMYGRYTSVLTPPMGVPENDVGTVLLAADTLIVVSDSLPSDPDVFTFAMPAATRLELTGEDTIDFDGDGIEEPATVEVVLDRR